MLEKLLENSEFQKTFERVDTISPEFMQTTILSRGIQLLELNQLLERGKIDIETQERANAARAFYNKNQGLKLSFTYGSNNGDFLSTILFSPNNLNIQNQHHPNYIKKYSQHNPINHKQDEQNYVVRANGVITLEDTHYLLIRTKDGTQIYRTGIQTNSHIQTHSKKGDNPFQNIIFGEYHFKQQDQEIEEFLIRDTHRNLDVIVSEVLGEEEITSQEDIKRLKKNDRFNPKKKQNYPNTSSSYLVEWYEKFKIPIIGIDFQKPIINRYNNQNTLSFIGRQHIQELLELSENNIVLLPKYDPISYVQ